MKIEKIDTNFIQTEYEEKDDKKTYTIPCAGFDLYGVFYDEIRGRFMRMNGNVAEKISEGVNYLSTHTSGGRIRFSTDSSSIGISVSYSSLDMMSHMPLTGSCGFSLLRKNGNKYKNVHVFRPSPTDNFGYTGEVTVKETGKQEYILYFPLYNNITKLEIHLDKAANVYPAEKYRDVKPILYYGASIDQGGCASRPDCSYPAIISKWNDIDFINLGFSGNAKGEKLMSEYLTGIDCSLCFIAYDGNAPTVEFLEETHFKFYQTYRKVKKDVPVVFMSVPCFDNYKDAYSRREVLKKSYETARALGDNNVYFIDGETLFGEKDREICTVEGIHPNDLGFFRIAEHIYECFGKIDKKFFGMK